MPVYLLPSVISRGHQVYQGTHPTDTVLASFQDLIYGRSVLSGDGNCGSRDACHVEQGKESGFKGVHGVKG
jgi:hypothetical protein